jgi:hypothetical protein
MKRLECANNKTRVQYIKIEIFQNTMKGCLCLLKHHLEHFSSKYDRPTYPHLVYNSYVHTHIATEIAGKGTAKLYISPLKLSDEATGTYLVSEISYCLMSPWTQLEM